MVGKGAYHMEQGKDQRLAPEGNGLSQGKRTQEVTVPEGWRSMHDQENDFKVSLRKSKLTHQRCQDFSLQGLGEGKVKPDF